MQHMKKLATLVLIPLLVACGGPRDIKLSAMNEPENVKKLTETLSSPEQELLRAYVVRHTMAGTIDRNKTVGEAIEAQKKEAAAITAVGQIQ